MAVARHDTEHVQVAQPPLDVEGAPGLSLALGQVWDGQRSRELVDHEAVDEL